MSNMQNKIAEAVGINLDGRAIKAVLLDLDGTLYRQPILRAFMAFEMLALPLSMGSLSRARKIWNAIYVFRKAREQMRELDDESVPLATLEYRIPASQLGMDERELEEIVKEWMHRRPLKYLKISRRPGLELFFEYLSSQGISIGIFSDYPAQDKLKALGVFDYVDLVISATDPQVNAFKPETAGFLKACEHWGLPADNVIYVGDRPEVDAVGAANAGMMPFIIGRKASGKGENNSSPAYTAVSSFSDLMRLLR